jgi:hypothetical protein
MLSLDDVEGNQVQEDGNINDIGEDAAIDDVEG